jgi:hypothetical protein
VAKNKQSRRQTGGGPAAPEISTVCAAVAGALAESLSPLDNPFDGDAGHHGDETIKFSEPSHTVPEMPASENETSKPSNNIGSKFFIGRRKRSHSSVNSGSEVTEETLQMRRREPMAKMEKLSMEKAYWRRKYEVEFGLFDEPQYQSNEDSMISVTEDGNTLCKL